MTRIVTIIVGIVLLFAILLDWWTMKQRLWSLEQELIALAGRPINKVVITSRFPIFEVPEGVSDSIKREFDIEREEK